MNKRQKVVDHDFTFFWKPSQPNGFLSNFSHHSVEENNIDFPTLEHYMHYHKAKLMGDDEAAESILEAKTPLEAKKLGRKVSNWDERLWKSRREEIMLNGVRLKVRQYPAIKEMLMETGDTTIAEASPYDRIWGIGLESTDSRAKHQSEWNGLNILGKVWMKVRESYLD